MRPLPCNYNVFDPGFARDLIGNLVVNKEKRIVEAFVSQAQHLGSGVFAGDPDDYMAQRQKQFADQVAALPDEPGLEELARALRRFT